jgi:hypothetical protein
MEGEGGDSAKNEWLDRLKSFSGLLGAVSAFGEDKLKLFSFLSPDVRNWQVAAVVAVLMGFVANKTAKRTSTLVPGWLCLIVAVVSLLLLFVWGTDRSLTGSDARLTTAKLLYALLFGFGASTLAWFLGSDTKKPRRGDK